MPTIAEIQAALAAGQGSTNTQIAQGMLAAGVTPAQLAEAAGVPVDAVISAWQATGIPLTTTASTPVQTEPVVSTPTTTIPVTSPVTTDAVSQTATTSITNQDPRYGGYGSAWTDPSQTDLNKTIRLLGIRNNREYGYDSRTAAQRDNADWEALGGQTELDRYLSDPGIYNYILQNSQGQGFLGGLLSSTGEFLRDFPTRELALMAAVATGMGALAPAGAAGAGGTAGGINAAGLTAEQLAAPAMSAAYTAPTLAPALTAAQAATIAGAGAGAAGAGAAAGGNWWDTLSNSFSTNPFGVLSSALGLGSGLTGLFGGTSDAQQAADPFAPYRAGAGQNLINFQNNPYSNLGWASTLPNTQATYVDPLANPAGLQGLASGDYINQLNTLMANPSSVTNLPGYQFLQQQGMQGVQRGLAARGQTVSGRELLALQEQDQGLANQQFLQQQALLSPLAQAQAEEARGVWNTQQNISLANAASQQRAQEFNTAGLMGQYNTQLSALSNLAGAGFNPASAATLGANQNQANWQAIMQGVGGLGGASQPTTTPR